MEFKMLVRPRSWDLAVVDEIFIGNEYVPTLIETDLKMETIVDLGGNIGAFSVCHCPKVSPK